MSGKFLTSIVSAALLCMVGLTRSEETATREYHVPGVRLAITLTNNVLVRGSTTLLSCWITNNSASGIVFMRGPGVGPGLRYNFGVWLSSEGGKQYVLIDATGTRSRMGDPLRQGEVRGYSVPVPIAADIPPGRYKLRAKRAVPVPGGPELHSNTLDVEVE
jgi:hypothetical protein